MLEGQLEARYLLYNLVSRGFKVKYRRSVLGIAWSLINPTMTMLVLIVSHSTDQLRRLCNRVLWIDHGKEMMCGPTQEVCDAYLANA